MGFITGASESFCEGCDRLRVTSDGRLRPCLATNVSVDVRRPSCVGDHGSIVLGLQQAWAQKPDAAAWRGCGEDTAGQVDMRATGG